MSFETNAVAIEDKETLAKEKFYYTWQTHAVQLFVIAIMRLFFKLFLHYKVIGRENLDGIPTKVIFIANHASELDSIVVPASLPYFSSFLPLFFVSREKGFYSSEKFGWKGWVYGGSLFKLVGAYQAYIGQHNYEIALRNHIQLLQDNRPVCIFPEGGTTKDGHLRPGKPGVAYLAQRTDTPVVPIAIDNLFNLKFKDVLLRRRHLTVRFGKPLYPKDLFPEWGQHSVYSQEQYKEVSDHLMNEIGTLLKT